jgi:pimeloyl-ACP methyl ester carboxylesterase
VTLEGRGRTFVREIGPLALNGSSASAPTVVLLHGWVASAALNWHQSFVPLAQHYRVLAPDLRGHARGLRSTRVFRLADCADDLAETLLELDTGPVIVVGYSMGGPIAQLFWRRHRDLCAGLVLCATAGRFMPSTRERMFYTTMMTAAVGGTRLSTITSRVPLLPERVAPIVMRTTTGPLPHWVAREVRRHNWRAIVEAGHSIGTYHSHWLGDVDVPTAIVVTTRDQAVPPDLQLAMAGAIESATVHEHDDGHIACMKSSFAPSLVAAVDDVAGRLRPATS